MSRIQSTIRKDGSTIYSLYLPNIEVEAAGLKKGDEVKVQFKSPGKLEVTKATA